MVWEVLIQILCIPMVAYFFIFKMIISLREQRRIEDEGIKCKATIVENKIEDLDGTYYHAVLKYKTLEGIEIISASDEGKMTKHEVGKDVTIYYLPTAPNKFIVEGSYPIVQVISICLGSLGVAILLLSILVTLEVI